MRGRDALSSWAFGIVAVAVVCRLAFYFVDNGMYYPDQIFQYLEPGHARLTGSGWRTWEYEVGARNWFLPALFGGWLEVGRALGFRRMELYRFMMLLSALMSVLIVPAGYRLGRALSGDQRTGLVVAATFAALPLFAYLAPHTLSENPALVFLAWGFAIYFDAERGGRQYAWHGAFAAGLLLGGAVLCRTAFAVFIPVVLVDLFVRRRERELIACFVGIVITASLLALLDMLTWGRPFQSVIELISANRDLGRALVAEGIAEPWYFYFTDLLLGRLGVVGCALLLFVPFARRRGVALVVFWLVPLLVFSYMNHKQERFAVGVLPLLIANAIVGVQRAALEGRLPVDPRNAWRWAAVAALFICVSSVPGTLDQPLRAHAGTFRAQDWIGQRDDASGVLVRGENANGGYLLMERTIPLVPFEPELAGHRVFDYVIADTDEMKETLSDLPAYRAVRTFEEAVVFGRNDPVTRTLRVQPGPHPGRRRQPNARPAGRD